MSLDSKTTYGFNTTNIAISEKIIRQNLINNLPEYICSMLACIISIDHEIRLKSIPQLTIHLNNCIYKLKHFLGKKVLADDNFTTILMLFAVAISPDIIDFQQQDNILNKSEDIIISTLISIYFKQTTLEEQNTIKLVLQILLRAKNNHQLINYLQVEPKIFCTIIRGAIKKHQNLKSQNLIAIHNQINIDLKGIVNITASHSKKVEQFKQISSKMVTAICAIAIGAVTVATAGATFALLVVPTAILAVKYAPKIGEKIGRMILNSDKSMLNEQKKINELKVKFDKNNNEFLNDQQLITDTEFYKINQRSTTTKKVSNLPIKKLTYLPIHPKNNTSQDNLNQKFLKDSKIKEQLKEQERQR